jgi:hypothetical protein
MRSTPLKRQCWGGERSFRRLDADTDACFRDNKMKKDGETVLRSDAFIDAAEDHDFPASGPARPFVSE